MYTTSYRVSSGTAVTIVVCTSFNGTCSNSNTVKLVQSGIARGPNIFSTLAKFPHYTKLQKKIKNKK
jgi:hypothetical protein